MEMNKNKFVKALLFSLVITILCSVAFGALYYFGYYWPWLSVVQIVFSCAAFFAKIYDPKWYHILISLIWGAVWAFIFNFVAILISETIYVVVNFHLSFEDSFIFLLENWRVNDIVKAGFEEKLKDVGTLTMFGVIVALVYVVVIYYAKKNKYKREIKKSVPNIVVESVPMGEAIPSISPIEVYNKALELIKNSLTDYLENKNYELFQKRVNYVRESILLKQPNQTKQVVETFTQKELNKDLSKIERRANEIIIELI